MTSQMFAVYGGKKMPVPQGTALPELKTLMARFFPELAEAKVETKTEGDVTTYVFSKQAGQKGADEPKGFEAWCIVELFGHTQVSGKVTEQVIGGGGFIRIDVPEVGEQAAYTQFVGPTAVYRLTPVSEEIARTMAARSRPSVVNAVMLPGPRAEMTLDDDPDDGGDYPSDDDDDEGFHSEGNGDGHEIPF